ncbi:MAG: tRNA (adenosine(37)-N6)-threonylcarbamoyltransferase complex dimerization subunit type 1 TsaB [Deltaproteobacteria bacterium]|nr:tRNA (adenosine(37)-N6)-threonylcarbamoyltransferase complex dimerization subunit type 1 TsaB [Deltaproteobacteria bacterium]
MKILALESATLTGSVALVDVGAQGGAPLHVEKTLDASLQHSEKLLPAVMEIVGDRLSSIDLFAVDIGPGSFTGLRVGVALMKGLAFATGKPLVGVSSLEALAMNAVGAQLIAPLHIVPMLDAYRGEVYTAVYNVGAGFPRPGAVTAPLQQIEPEQATPPEKWLKYLVGVVRERPLQFIGDGAVKYQDLIQKIVGARFIAPVNDHQIHATNVAFLAKKTGAVDLPPLHELKPRYLRPGV